MSFKKTYMAFCNDCHEYNEVKRRENGDDQCPCSSNDIVSAEECDNCQGFGVINEGFVSGDYKEIEKVTCPKCKGNCYTHEKKRPKLTIGNFNYEEIFSDIFGGA